MTMATDWLMLALFIDIELVVSFMRPMQRKTPKINLLSEFNVKTENSSIFFISIQNIQPQNQENLIIARKPRQKTYVTNLTGNADNQVFNLHKSVVEALFLFGRKTCLWQMPFISFYIRRSQKHVRMLVSLFLCFVFFTPQ